MSSVLHRLKNETLALHQQLESVSYAKEIRGHQLGFSQYVDLLLKNEYCYRQVEEQLASTYPATPDSPLSLFASNRGNDLRVDLANLEIEQTFVDLPWAYTGSPPSLPRLLGTLYVLEGARLGGNVIVKALKKTPQLASIDRFHFFEQDGIHVGQRWRLFRNLMSSLVFSPGDEEQVVEAANRLFGSFYQVFKENISKLSAGL